MVMDPDETTDHEAPDGEDASGTTADPSAVAFSLGDDGEVVETSAHPSDIIVVSEEDGEDPPASRPPTLARPVTVEFDQTMAGELSAEDVDLALSGLTESEISLEEDVPLSSDEVVTRRSKQVDTKVETVVEQADGGSLEERVLQKLDEAENRPHEDPLIGMVLGDRFEVLQKIGEGGMGAVYKARQRGIEREVAVKVLLGDVARNKTLVRRFHLEALAISKLKHPNTIQIFDFGETPDGLLYIAMEFLEGTSLQSLLEFEEVLSVQRAVRIARQMAQSLREAHGKEIVHRDLKPDNVFLTSVGEESDFVKVLDFGVAKLREGDKKGATVTKTGTIFGTPRYMSPEQAKGKPVDARGDLYAIGIMLYEMVMGGVPFESDNHLGVLILHVQKAPPTFAEKRPDLVIPPQLESLVFKLLAKNPDDRYQTAEALIRSLERVDKGIDEMYRLVVRREEALGQGFDPVAAEPTHHDTRMDEHAEQALPTMGPFADVTVTVDTETPPPPKRIRWVSGSLKLLFAVAASLSGFVALLQPLPAGFHGIPALAILDVGVQPSAEVPWSQITIASDPAEADVVRVDKAGKETPVGKTPLSLRRHRGARPETYAFSKKGYKRYQRSFEFNADLVETVKLNPDKAAAPPKGASRSRGSTKKPARGVKAAPSKGSKPFQYAPGKVGTTKSSPY